MIFGDLDIRRKMIVKKMLTQTQIRILWTISL